MAMALPDQPLVWIDCEMTGLDPDHDVILEIYCLVTDGQLHVPAAADDPGFHAVVHCPAARLAQMDAWCTAHHAASGLSAACVASTTTPEQAADGLLRYVRARVPDPRVGLLAGNSVHADRAFLARGPYAALLAHLHYRILDVSSLKEAAVRWRPSSGTSSSMYTPPPKKAAHRARDDILESISEARFYKETFFERPAPAWAADRTS